MKGKLLATLVLVLALLAASTQPAVSQGITRSLTTIAGTLRFPAATGGGAAIVANATGLQFKTGNGGAYFYTSDAIVTVNSGLFVLASGGTAFSTFDGFTTTGQVTLANGTNAIGVRFKVDALPTVSACGAGTPAVTALSSPLSGSVTVGTGAPATCAITFNGAAFSSVPHCSGAVETTTAANARAMGYSASTSVLTIVPSAAWADSSVVNWTCFSPK